MKFTLSWLKEHLDTNASIEEISKTLTEIGLEVESIENKAEKLEPFKVVEVMDVRKHPDADKLNICKIKTEKEIFELVCGAPNVRAGIKAVLAPLGSVIPANQMKVKKVKIRGIESIGMLCSAKELAVGDEQDGIIELAANTQIGEKISSILGLDDPIIEIAITPNRGDCLGVYGIARDLAAAKIGVLKATEVAQLEFVSQKNYSANSDSSFCRQLDFVELKNVVNKESPEWLRKRLEAIGLQPKNAVIDATNYMLYNYGQPLHAYDADKLEGSTIAASLTKKKETFLALNDKEYALPEGSLTIKDEGKIIALAGIIGAKNTATELSTTNILLEAANFNANKIAEIGRVLQIDTDSRYRFERETDQSAINTILKKTAKLIIDICGGEVCSMASHVSEDVKLNKASLRFAEFNNAASYKLSPEKIKEVLISLGFNVSRETLEEVEVLIPAWRNDVRLEVDLIEEVLRIVGFSQIPAEPISPLNKEEENNLDIESELSQKKLLASLGLNEVISWSFYSKQDDGLFGFQSDLELVNPISEDLSVMRSSLVPNLVSLAVKEQNKGEDSIAVFEYGRIFHGKDQDSQHNSLSVLRLGSRFSKEVNNDSRDYDVFDVKADILRVLEEMGFNVNRLEYRSTDLPSYFHQNRAAKLYLGKNYLGCFGELHPAIAQKLGIKGRLNIAELFLANLPKLKKKNPIFENYNLQAINRDFCFIVDKKLEAAALKKELLKSDQQLVKEVRIFDLYEGESLPDGKKSIALTAKLQPKERALTGEELELFNKLVIENFAKKFDAKLP